MSRALTVGLVQCWSQSSSFLRRLLGRFLGRPFSSRSKRVATAVVLSSVRRDYRGQPLRRGVGVAGILVVGVDRDRLLEVKDLGTKVDGEREAVCRLRS